MKRIIPIEITKRGKTQWYINVPQVIVGDVGKSRLFFQSRATAEREAKKLEAIRHDHLSGFEMLPAEDRALVGRCVREAGGPAKLAKIVADHIANCPTEEKTITDLCQDLIDSKTSAGLTSKYIRDSLGVTTRRFKETFGCRLVHTITPEEIHQWLYGSSKWASETAWNHLKNVRTMFNYALKRRLVASNVATAVEWPKITRRAPCILTVAEAEALMRAAEKDDPGMIPVLAMVLFGGLRPDESQRCRKDYISESHIALPATSAKNNKRRLIELNELPTLKAWLSVSGGEYGPRNYRRRLDALRISSKVKWGHDILRHSFVSYAVPIYGIVHTSLLADHSETVLKKHYRELVPKTSAEAFWRIMPAL